MQDNIVKKQHYIPRFYLRRFSEIHDVNNDQRNKMLVFNKETNKIYPSSVYGIACENYFYDIKNIIPVKEKQAIEKAFSSLESNYSNLLNKLIYICERKENQLKALISTKKEKEELAFCIVMQLIRIKKYRNILKFSYNNCIEKINTILKENYCEKRDNTNEYKIDEKTIHLKQICNTEFIGSLTNFLLNSYWIFIKNETETPFIISDNPVCRIPRLNEHEISILFSDKLEIYFPLSPNVVIYIFRNETPNFNKLKNFKNRLIPMTKIKEIDVINQFQCIMANERIFVNPKYKYLLERYCKDNLVKKTNLIL